VGQPATNNAQDAGQESDNQSMEGTAEHSNDLEVFKKEG